MICERAKLKADSLSALENIKTCAVYETYKPLNEQKTTNFWNLAKNLVETVVVVEEINFIDNNNLNMMAIKRLCARYML